MVATLPNTSDRSLQVARSTLIVIGGTVLSFGVGLIRRRVITGQFGLSAKLDAYSAVDGLAELLLSILASGTLVFAFMPQYVELLASENKPAADRLASQVFNLLGLAAIVAALFVAVFAPVFVTSSWGIGPGHSVETQELMVRLLRVLMLSMILFTLSALITGILHSHQHFWLPAISPTVYSVGVIIGAVVLAPTLGIEGVAWGAVIGAAFHMLVQVPALRGDLFRWTPIVSLSDPKIRNVLRLMAPRIVDLLMARISLTWLAANLNSYLGEGKQSAMTTAYSVVNIPWTLIGTAIGFAIFPLLSELATQNDPKAFRSGLSGGIRAVLVLAIPSALGLLVFGRPLIQILYEGNRFDSDSTELVYFALQFYALTLISQSLLDIVVRAYAATKDTITPLLVSFLTTAVNLGLAIWLTRPISDGGIEHGGPPLANGVAVLLEVIIGLFILHLRWKGIDARRIFSYGLRALIASAVMAAVVILIQNLLSLSSVMFLLAGAPFGILIYAAMLSILGVREVWSVPIGLFKTLHPRDRERVPSKSS